MAIINVSDMNEEELIASFVTVAKELVQRGLTQSAVMALNEQAFDAGTEIWSRLTSAKGGQQ